MPEITKTPGQKRFSKDGLVWLILAGLALVVYFYGLTIPLVGPDEPRYAQVAREMYERGDWVTPTLGGFTWFEKPALLYWLEILSYKLFGVSEFSARFGSALFGLGTVASLWILGRSITSWWPERARENRLELTNTLALVAASTLGLIVFSHGASFDIILTFPMTAAMVSFFISDSSPGRKNLSLFCFYFFVGVALLAKGLVGIVFPAAIVCFYYLLSWRPPDKKFILSLIWGTIVTLAVAAVWYLPVYQRNGYAFIDEFIIQHHFQRFTSNKYFHPQPFYFFFWVLPLMTIPWLPFFLAALWTSGKGLLQRRDAETQRREWSETVEGFAVAGGATLSIRHSATPLFRFLIAWMLVPLVFFSFSGSKLPGYILPAVPPAIVFAAVFVWQFAWRNELRKLLAKAIAGATFLIIIALLLFVVPRFAEGDSVKGLIAAANGRGFVDAKVLSMHTVSHNAEFYAAGRLVREGDGKQRKFLGPLEVLEEMRREGNKPVLVLIPLEYSKQLTESRDFRGEAIKDNGEIAIVAVTPN
jgi:4-amino-4-deoxy-L-arabinose transferase-like glycosyltransferase